MFCKRHPNQKMLLLFNSFICDVCDPPKNKIVDFNNLKLTTFSNPKEDWKWFVKDDYEVNYNQHAWSEGLHELFSYNDLLLFATRSVQDKVLCMTKHMSGMISVRVSAEEHRQVYNSQKGFLWLDNYNGKTGLQLLKEALSTDSIVDAHYVGFCSIIK